MASDTGMTPRTGPSTTAARSAAERTRLSHTSRAKARAYPSRTPPTRPTPRYLNPDGERVVGARADGDMSTTSIGESSPSSCLTCSADWRTTSSAMRRARSSDDAVAVTVIVRVLFLLVADSERDSWAGVMSSPRESMTPCATASEVNTGTKALTFWLASWEAAYCCAASPSGDTLTRM